LDTGSSTSSSRSGIVENLIAHEGWFLMGNLGIFRPVCVGVGATTGRKSGGSDLGEADCECAWWELGS
jgi:hypothetical protein